jgi:hypothetical protein
MGAGDPEDPARKAREDRKAAIRAEQAKDSQTT